MKSWTKPTAELIHRAIASTTDPEQRRYFFNNLQNPFWAKPLWDEGFFRKPPEPVPTGDGGFQILFWPESQYLARVAKEVAEEVVNIVVEFRTGNPRVLEDLIDIALAIDSRQLSKKLSKHAAAFAENPLARWYYKKLGKLILHWAKLGMKAEALKLTKRIISFRPNPRRTKKEQAEGADSGNIYALSNQRQKRAPYCDLYVYQKLLEEDVMQLVELLPWDTTRLLTTTLANAISWSLSESERQQSYDASDFWCRDVKFPRQYGDEPKGYLAHALTRACEAVLQKEPSRILELDDLLKTHKWYFFTRLRWHLYAQFPQIAKTQISEEAINFDGYEDGEYGYEFASMLMAASKNHLLTDQELNHIFQKIANGPDIEAHRRWQGGQISEEQIEKRKGYFFTKQMFPFSPVLSGFPEYLSKYQSLIKKHGERALSEYFKIGEAKSFSYEEKSPLTANELLAKPDADLLNFLRDWKPPVNQNDFDSHSFPGLSKVFMEILKTQPERLLSISDRLTLSPALVQQFLYFVTGVAKQKEALPWDKIIQLSEWVISESRNSPDKSSDEEAGKRDFTECHRAVVSLLKNGSLDYQHTIPWEFRERVFSILERLCNNYDPRLDGGRKNAFGGDLLTQAINSVRAEAVHALVDHAFWIKRKLGLTSNAMQSMIEVQQVLEGRLEASREKSLAVHGLIGFLTPSLYHLDTQWCASVRERIFPSGAGNAERWAAAWTTYISWNQASEPLFKFLREEYKKAVLELESFRKIETSESRATEALSEHLIISYGWGLIPLAGENALLEEFLKKATAEERAHIMNYAGRALENPQPVPQEIKTRLMAYWDFRFSYAKSEAKPEESSEELSDFAWWFRSGKFELSWSLKQLQRLLEFVSKVPETTFLLEDLAKIASEKPAEAATCLQLIVKKSGGSSYVYLEEEAVKQILRTAANSQIPEAVKTANAVQDDLLRLGRFEYRDYAGQT